MDDPPSPVTPTPAAAVAVGPETESEDIQARRPPLWRRFARHRLAMASLGVIFLLVLVAILADVITPYNPYALTFDPTLPPGAQHWLGTDELGRDELSRVILGARI